MQELPQGITLLLKITKQFLGGTMVQMRAIYQACLIIAECSPLKTKSVLEGGGGQNKGLKS